MGFTQFQSCCPTRLWITKGRVLASQQGHLGLPPKNRRQLTPAGTPDTSGVTVRLLGAPAHEVRQGPVPPFCTRTRRSLHRPGTGTRHWLKGVGPVVRCRRCASVGTRFQEAGARPPCPACLQASKGPPCLACACSGQGHTVLLCACPPTLTPGAAAAAGGHAMPQGPLSAGEAEGQRCSGQLGGRPWSHSCEAPPSPVGTWEPPELQAAPGEARQSRCGCACPLRPPCSGPSWEAGWGAGSGSVLRPHHPPRTRSPRSRPPPVQPATRVKGCPSRPPGACCGHTPGPQLRRGGRQTPEGGGKGPQPGAGGAPRTVPRRGRSPRSARQVRSWPTESPGRSGTHTTASPPRTACQGTLPAPTSHLRHWQREEDTPSQGPQGDGTAESQLLMPGPQEPGQQGQPNPVTWDQAAGTPSACRAREEGQGPQDGRRGDPAGAEHLPESQMPGGPLPAHPPRCPLLPPESQARTCPGPRDDQSPSSTHASVY